MHTKTPAGAGPVDQLVRPAEARWYCVDRNGVAMLCANEADANWEVADNTKLLPKCAPYIAVLLVDAAEIDRLRETLKLQQASYEREILLDVAAERERLARNVEALHMAQTLNNQNYPPAWHDGIDEAVAVIRGA